MSVCRHRTASLAVRMHHAVFILGVGAAQLTHTCLLSLHHDHHQPKKKATHPAFGQYGLFAAVPLPPRSWVVDYIGRVTDSVHCSKTSDYTMSLGAAGMCVSVYSWWWCQQCSSCLFSVCSNEYTVIFLFCFIWGEGAGGWEFWCMLLPIARLAWRWRHTS